MLSPRPVPMRFLPASAIGSAAILALILAGCGSSDTGTPGSGGSGGEAASGGHGGTGTAGTVGSGTAGTVGNGGTVGSGGGGVSGTFGTAGTIGSGGGPAGGSGGAAGAGGHAGSGGGGRGAGGTGASGTSGSAGHGGAAGAGAGGHGGTGGAAAGAGGHGGGTAGAGGAPSSTLRIMPLGDSTTASICYRSHLWQMLTNAGHTRFDFIGTRNGDPGCSFTGYDKDNEGHGGYIVTDLLKATSTGRPSGADSTDPYVSSSADLATWFNGHPADVVLMHFGTNDVWNNIAAGTILQAYSAILARLRANNPNVRLLIAQITPLDPSGCTTCAAGVQTLDSMIPGWATSNSTAQSPISVVDQYTGFDATTDTKDGVHANDGGSIKIATNWYNALVPLF
jgi:lysophospholipase L1-like esterase